MMLRLFSARVVLSPNKVHREGGVDETKLALMRRLEDSHPLNQEENR